MKPLILTALLTGAIIAQTTISPNPLAGLPSAPGPTIPLIEAMDDNSWLCLGTPGLDSAQVRAGREGWAYAHAWGSRSMIYAPRYRGVFHTGEAWHAYVKSDGFGGDDYWFYDINGNRWICLYPGTDVHHFNDAVTSGLLSVDTLGRAVDTAGQPVPGHLLIHSWGNLTYDTRRDKFVFDAGGPFGRYYMPGLDIINPGLTALEAQGLNKTGYTFGPWAYNPQTGKFERDLAANARIGSGGFGQFMYDPALDVYVSIGGGGVAYFDPATGLSRSVSLNGVIPGGYEYGGVYDSRRDRFYLGDAPSHFFCYDVATETGTDISGPQVAPYTTSSLGVMDPGGSLDYDSLSDVVLGFAWNTRMLLLFDPETQVWVDAMPFDPAFSSALTPCAFYDPVLGVHFIYQAGAGGNGNDGIMWVYKFRNKATVDKEKTLQSVTLVADDAVVEQYLWTQLRMAQTYSSLPADTTASFLKSVLTNLTPDVVSVSTSGHLRALTTGTARIAVEKAGFKDTLDIPITASTAATDSILLSPDTACILAGEYLQLNATGYHSKDAKTFTRRLDTAAVWSSADEDIVTVDMGALHGVSQGGPIEVSAVYGGRTGKAVVTVWPSLSYLKRINFQCSSTPWKYDWLAATGAVYSAPDGYGWTSQGDCRDDRNGPTILKTFASSSAPFRLDAPAGRYIIKTCMGDNVYGTNSVYSTVFNGDTVNLKPSGTANGVNVDTIEVTGDSGALFTVNGPINYLIMISDQGVDINLVADDGGLADNEEFDGSTNEEALGVGSFPGISIIPNPLNPSAVIQIRDPQSVRGTLTVFSVDGKRVFQHRFSSSERQVRVSFSGKDLASGVYYAVYRHNAVSLNSKMMLLK